MSDILIIGSGGHAGVVIDTLLQLNHNVIGLLDDFLEVGQKRHGISVVGRSNDSMIQNHLVFIAVGDNAGRFEVFKKINPLCPRIIAVVHPQSSVSPNANIMSGCFIASGAVVGNDSTAGAFSIVNTNASLDHDSSLGEFSHLAPNSATGGRVKIGRNCMIGIGASIRDGITIGDNSTIGMGACVVKSVGNGVIEFGNPSREHL
jgi:sugar O-acyltransferase (sialic acid O-acetyltransferase NeuD family)